jgi:hypothetical protein
MTLAERRICETLAERFPDSAQASGGTAVRLRIASSFPEVSRSKPDERENFLEAAERLEKDGVVSLVWERYRVGEDLKAIILTNPEGLYARLGLSFPVSAAETARKAAREAAQNAAGDSRAAAFFAWLADNLTASDVLPLEGPGELASLVADIATLIAALSRYAPEGVLKGITPRALSVRLFADSKKIERVIERSRAIFRRAERAAVAPPDFSPVGRSYPETLVAGSLVFTLDDGTRISNEPGLIIGLPLASAMRITSVTHADASPKRSKRPTLLTVENKETFYALSASENSAGTILYVGGHPNPAVVRLVSVFAQSEFALYHAGDLDIEGILILQELADAANATITPVRMDRETFDFYGAHARNLEDNALKRAALLRDDTRRLLGIEGLLERILSTGKGLEQEIIDYANAVR